MFCVCVCVWVILVCWLAPVWENWQDVKCYVGLKCKWSSRSILSSDAEQALFSLDCLPFCFCFFFLLTCQLSCKTLNGCILIIRVIWAIACVCFPPLMKLLSPVCRGDCSISSLSCENVSQVNTRRLQSHLLPPISPSSRGKLFLFTCYYVIALLLPSEDLCV